MTKKQVQRDPDLLARIVNNMVLSGRLLMDNRVSRGVKMIPLVVCLYILSPLDLLPELAFGPFGILDDITIFLVGLQVFIQNTPKDVREEYQGKKKKDAKRKIAPGTVIENDAQDDDNLPIVLNGEYEVRED